MDYFTNPPYYLTAYGLAVKYGYEGTEQEFVEELMNGAAHAAERASVSAAEALAQAQLAEAEAENAASSAAGAEGAKTAAQESAAAAATSASEASASAVSAADYAGRIAEPVGGLVTSWLEENVDPATGYVIDNSLTVSGAAADGAKVGAVRDTLTTLAADGNLSEPITVTWNQGGINSSTGSITENATRIRTDVIRGTAAAMAILAEHAVDVMIYAYRFSINTSQYVGKITPAWVSCPAGKQMLIPLDRGLAFCVVARYHDDASILPAEGANITIQKYNAMRADSSAPAVTLGGAQELTGFDFSWSGGTLDSDTGATKTSEYVMRSAFVPVHAGERLTFMGESGDTRVAFAYFYDGNDAYIRRVSLLNSSALVPDGAASMRLTYGYTTASGIVLNDAWPEMPKYRLKIEDVRLDELAGYNSAPIRLYDDVTREGTVHGITYSIQNGVVTLSGTATANAYLEFEGSINSIPGWVRNGRYYARIEKAVEDEVKYQLMHYVSSGTSAASFVSAVSSGYFEVAGIDNYEGVISRLKIAKGLTVDNTIKVSILSAIPNEDLSREETAGSPTKVRLMQYNLGKFNMGQPLDASYHFLTTANCDSVLNNYKALFGDVQPDMIGFEEYESAATAKGVDGAEDRAVNLNTELFNRLYPTQSAMYGALSKGILKSKYPLLDSANKILDYTYTYDGVDYSGTFHVIYAHARIAGREIALVVNAFPNSVDGYPDERNLLLKEAHYQAVVDLLADDEIAFIICDANAGPTVFPTILEDVLIPAGYNSAHGSYFPWQTTWESIKSGKTNAIDNILYKGPVQLVNFKVLWDARAGLASDHAPVYADFLIF